ncbi:MAG: hypothetical protein QXV17_14340 [Candidatus Micrarchaeaceae archaeon]
MNIIERYKDELVELDKNVIRNFLKEKIDQWYKNKPKVFLKRYFNKDEIENININEIFNQVCNWLLEIFSLHDLDIDTNINEIYLNGVLVFSINKLKDYNGNDMIVRDLDLKYIKKQAYNLIKGV